MGSYIPKIQRQGQQPSGMDLFMQQFLQGYQIGQQRLAQQREAEAFEMQRQQHQQTLEYHKLNMQKIKSELALQEMFGPQAMQQQQNQQQLKGETDIFSALQQIPGQRITAPNRVEPMGLAGPPTLGPDGSQISPGAAPPMTQPQGPGSLLPHVTQVAGRPAVTSLEQTQAQGLQQLLQKLQMEAQGEYAKTQAQEEAKRAPLSFSLPGVGDVTVPGTIADQVASGAMTGINQGRQQAFTAGENRLNRGTQLKAAGISADATRAGQAGTREDKMLDDFARDTKEFVSMDDAYAKIKAAATGESGASDLSLVYGYMKLLDPNSVVREGEVANASNTAGVPDRIITAYNKALRGERLAPAQRNAFIAESKKVYDAVKPRLKQVERRYQDRAKKVGADPGLFSFQSNAGAAPTGPTATDPKTGKKVQWNGSAWVPLQ